jgi:uncharacterized damage-inducible protein DinB
MQGDAMNEKEMYLQTWDNEFQRTMKVLNAYPTDKPDFKPHEKSRSTKDLAWTFVMEEKIIDHVIKGEVPMSAPPPAPKTLQEVKNIYESSHKEMFNKVKSLPDAEFDKTVKFPTGPKQTGDFRRLDIFKFMLMDMVHHRGQLSVYLRMAGGKVPSIYGPSGDEPWM